MSTNLTANICFIFSALLQTRMENQKNRTTGNPGAAQDNAEPYFHTDQKCSLIITGSWLVCKTSFCYHLRKINKVPRGATKSCWAPVQKFPLRSRLIFRSAYRQVCMVIYYRTKHDWTTNSKKTTNLVNDKYNYS